MVANLWTPLHAVLVMLAGFLPREQDAVIAFQKEEIRALREMLGGRRLRFPDAQRRRLARKAKAQKTTITRLAKPLDTVLAPTAQ